MTAIQTWGWRMVVSLSVVAASSASASPQSGIVVAWGDNASGQANTPFTLTNAVAVAGGYDQSLALNSNGTVVAWGTYFNGSSNVLMDVPPDLTNATAIAAGTFHCLALKPDSTVAAWGTYKSGSLWLPASVPAGLTNVVAIAAGGFQSLALKRGGTVVGWGSYFNGSTNVPTTVPAGLTGVKAVAAGVYHCVALKSNGNVVAWGNNSAGQTNVPAGLTGVTAIACGDSHSLALKSNGTVVAWGTYFNGSAYAPATNTPAGLTNVAAIAAGGFQNLALKTDNSLATWGTYFNGSTWVPAAVPAGLSNVVAIGAGYYHSLAVTLEPLVLGPLPSVVSMALGDTTNLNVSVWSRTPFGCQWSLNGTAIDGATNTTLTVTDFDPSQGGAYTVLVTNQSDQQTLTSLVRIANSPTILVNGAAVAGGTLDRTNAAQVNISSTATDSTNIYFTLDGSPPDLVCTHYTNAFILTNSAVIRAIAYDTDYKDAAEAAPVTLNIWPLYPLTATTPSGGTISNSPAPYSGGNLYVSNTLVTLTATASTNWSFLGWTGDSAATTSVTTVRMDRSRAVQAIFGTTLSLFTNGSGQVMLQPPTGPYAYGTNVWLTALPSNGCYFVGWKGAASGFANPLSFPITTATPGITALFGLLKTNQFSLTVLPGAGGTVSNTSPTNVYTIGQSITLTALPASNYVFTGWGGDASGTNNPLSFTLDSSKLITGNFAPRTPVGPSVTLSTPLSRVLSPGFGTTLSASQVAGDGPLSYQWRLNAMPISGATASKFVLSNLVPEKAGLYDLVVTGAAGAATSAPATIALFGVEFVRAMTGAVPLLTLASAPGTRYRVESSANVPATNWSVLAPVTLDGVPSHYVDEPATNPARRFYRAVPQ